MQEIKESNMYPREVTIIKSLDRNAFDNKPDQIKVELTVYNNCIKEEVYKGVQNTLDEVKKMFNQDIYPVFIEINGDIGENGVAKEYNRNIIIDSRGAITVKVTISDSCINKCHITEGLAEISGAILEYFK